MGVLLLSVSLIQRDGWDIVSLEGSLKEGAGSTLRSATTTVGSNCVIDFGKTASVNSSGIAEWIDFLEDFERNRVIVYQNCTTSIVDVLNLVPAFRGQSKVRSVRAPFDCVSCGASSEISVDIGPNFDPISHLVSGACTKCNGELAPAADWDEYFRFMTY